MRHSLRCFLVQACYAYPDEVVEFWAEATHIEYVKNLLGGCRDRVVFRTIELSQHLPEKVEAVSLRRLFHDLSVLWRTRHSWRNGTVLVVSSASATGIFAAAAVQLVTRAADLLIQVPLHGQISALRSGYRPRNPLYRALDLFSAFRICRAERFRYVVFEETIKHNLEQLVPELSGSVDVLPHPAIDTETRPAIAADDAGPIRVGMLGVATYAKGFDTYLRIARRIQAEQGGRVEFHLVGFLHASFHSADVTGLSGPVATWPMSREDFIAAVNRLHFVCSPLKGVYYDLAASGSLIDAFTFKKPIVVLKSMLTSRLFEEHGDIGYLCEDEAEMYEVLSSIAKSFDPARYRKQTEAIEALYHTRTPAALAARYRKLVSGPQPQPAALAQLQNS